MTGSQALRARVEALGEARLLSVGRGSAEVLEEVAGVVERAGRRLSLIGDQTVVALAGATGSGKSTAFNALSGTELAVTGVRRPTTSQPMAAAWGTELPHELLDWLDVTRRHLIPAGEGELRRLVLLDLPDYDSTEASHRLTVDRLIQHVDMLVWIVDPQKYADAALHEGYLKPLAAYAEVMVVVLNQADRLWGDELENCVGDLRRLLDAEGLGRTRVLSMSALTGVGVRDLRDLLIAAVAKKQAAILRLSADVELAAGALLADLGEGAPHEVTEPVRSAVVDALAEAAGVATVAAAVGDTWRHRGGLATGWPFVSWIARLRPDPIRALRLDQNPRRLAPTQISRTSLPRANAVQRAKVDEGLRGIVDDAAAGLPRGWVEAIKATGRGQEARLLDRLDTAIAMTDLGLERHNYWWSLVRGFQWTFIVALIVGVGWLLAGGVLASAHLELPDLRVLGAPVPLVVIVVSVLGGLFLAGLSALGLNRGARRATREARSAMRAAIAAVAREEIFEPVEREQERYRRALAAARRAL